MTEQPGHAPFVPPVHYVRDDGVECCVHTTPVGPDSCPACRDLTDEDEERTPAPPLPAPIHTHSQWCWEPLRPLLKTRVRITDTRWDGETWWVETEALENSRMGLAGRRRWDALDSFIESAVAIDPDL